MMGNTRKVSSGFLKSMKAKRMQSKTTSGDITTGPEYCPAPMPAKSKAPAKGATPKSKTV
jgi:hypothetical protein